MWNYNDDTPSNNYDAFVKLSGCDTASDKFACLVDADSEVLQNASGTVSNSTGPFGSFGFLPVVDGEFIANRPVEQLAQGKIAGKRILLGVS